MASENVLPPSLPLTVAARRNARLRAAAIATIPFLLVLIAVVPRLWEPDLVPFGARQAEYVSAASSRVPLSWAALYGDLTVTPLMLVQPLLRELPAPVVLWVMMRGLLDSLGVAFLFLAARPLVGVWGATLAALLYALNPTTWAAVRDPAGPLTAVFMAAALWVAVRLAQRPTLLRGAILGVVLGMLARSIEPGLLVVALGALTLALARASWKVGGLTALALVVTAGPAILVRPDLSIARVGSYVALALPGWLVHGVAYQLHDGQVEGTTFLLSSDTVAVISVAGLLVASVGIIAAFARRLSPKVWLPILWLALCWLSAALSLKDALRRTDGMPETMLAPLAVALVAPVALVVVLPMAAPLRFARWWGLAGGLTMLAASGAMIGASAQGIARFASDGGALSRVYTSDRSPPSFRDDWPKDTFGRTVSYGAITSLRDWMALANAVSETAARIDADEVLTVNATPMLEDRPLQALLGERLRVRHSEAAIILPLERESIILLARPQDSDLHVPTELRRPSSTTPVYAPGGVDTGVRLRTLRPRPAGDWIARAQVVQNGRFADGSTLLAVGIERAAAQGEPGSVPGQKLVSLYWQLPAASLTGPGAQIVAAALRGTPQTLDPPSTSIRVADRRDGELTVVQFAVVDVADGVQVSTTLDGSLLVWLTDLGFKRILTASGDDELVIPPGRAP